ncbi:MAG: type I-C CRISPR-associated protein Cas7/Csd2 [bacterium]|nr:type I-C CRISPR-associated protein Cas7/Csd2 [bacterium]MDE0417135.1 type I-C CRISPR-associated protein Cas7/Csd2 [bacterium]
MGAIQKRYDFVYLFDVANGNPNGDPDAGNLPRLDPETNQGLVSDVSLKRKVRNYVTLAKDGEPGHEIFVGERAILELQQKRAWDAILPEATDKERQRLPRDERKARELSRWMCANFFDIRAFGAVMSTRGANCGQVRGPVQFAFARSVEPILPLEISITRMAATTTADAERQGDIRTMGRKHIVPYGLYRTHGFVSACLAGDSSKGTGFSEDDLELLWTALEQMFDHDRSAARGEMAARRLILFRHESKLGNAPAHKLFERVTVKRIHGGEDYEPGDPRAHNLPPARAWSDYRVYIDSDNLPAGVEIVERV